MEIFEDIWQKAHNAPNINQKEKYEADLKKEIKKLQRLRDQIKTWIASSEIKDKRSLVEDRKLIETQMERFKVLERETKTKAYSKEGLGAAQKLDPVQREKEDLCNWMTNSIESLNIQIDQFESEIESLSVHLRKKKNDKDKQERVDKLKSSVDKHKYHINQLETLMRMLDNSTVDVHQVKGIKDDVEYYIESSQEPDFEENEYIYDDLELEDISEFLNKSKMNSTASTTGSANNSTTQKEPGAATTTGVCTTTTATTTTMGNTSTTSQTSLSQEALHTSTSSLSVQSSLNNGVCKPEDESHTTSVQSTGPKGTPCDSPTPSLITDFSDSVSTAAGVCLQMNGPVDCNHIADKITTNGAPHLVNHSTSISSNSSMNFAISSLSNAVAASSSSSSVTINSESGSSSSGSCSSSSITISTSKLVWSGVTSNSSVSTVCTNNSNNSQCSPPLDPSAGLLYASAAAAVKHSDQLPAAASVAFSQAQTNSTAVNQQQLQQQLHQQLQQQQQQLQQLQQQQQNQLHHQQLSQQLQAIGSQSSSSTSSSTTSNGEQQQFSASTAASGLYSQAATSNGGWNRVTQPNGPLNRLSEEPLPSMSSLKSIAQQAVMSAGLTVNQLEQTAVTASAVSPSLHAQFSSVTGCAAPGSLGSLSNSQASQQMLNLINAGAAAAAAAAASTVSAKPMPMLLGGSTAGSGVQQASEAHIPPLLGVAPLGPIQLPKPCIYQLHMLEAACRHVIHPLDSQRARSYLPSGSVPSPSFYPQQALPHSDTLDFFHRLSTETLFFIFYFMEVRWNHNGLNISVLRFAVKLLIFFFFYFAGHESAISRSKGA